MPTSDFLRVSSYSRNAAWISCWFYCWCMSYYVWYARTCIFTYVLISFIFSTYYARCGVKSRVDEMKVNTQCGEKEKRVEDEERRGRNCWWHRRPFMEGLRFRRLANEQECLRLTAEWKPGESMIGPAIACQRIALCASPFFPSPLHPRSRHYPWKTMEIGKKIPPVRLRWKLS